MDEDPLSFLQHCTKEDIMTFLKSNLHSLWDTAIPKKHTGQAYGMVAARIWAQSLYEADPDAAESLYG
jgi:hypothetical protein